MITKQLSVFLENQTGRLDQVSKVLAEAGINMTAFSVADGSDFGLLRVIVDQPEEARVILKSKGFSASLTDVIALNVANTPGTLALILDALAAADVYIEYMYAFSQGAEANVIIRPTDVEKGIAILHENDVEIASL